MSYLKAHNQKKTYYEDHVEMHCTLDSGNGVGTKLMLWRLSWSSVPLCCQLMLSQFTNDIAKCW